jgi:hypothetical protein
MEGTMALVTAFGRCGFCGTKGKLTVEGDRTLYCDEECRTLAGDAHRCSIDGCGGTAAQLSPQLGNRCEACAPGGCHTCWVWGRGSCSIHRFGPGEAVPSISAASPQNNAPAVAGPKPASFQNRYPREVKILCGEHLAFVAKKEVA